MQMICIRNDMKEIVMANRHDTCMIGIRDSPSALVDANSKNGAMQLLEMKRTIVMVMQNNDAKRNQTLWP